MEFNFESTAEDVTEGLDLTGQTWLVTGSNSGLGLETIRVLALRGADIIAAARTEEKAERALQSINISGMALACELSDMSSVRAAVETVKALAKPLAGIIANAGIMALPTLQQKKGIELQFYTNHIGHFALVTGLRDQLANNGRVVMLSSGAHFYSRKSGLELDNLSGEKDYDDWRMYGRSKLANILFANELNKSFAGSLRTANAVHPGVIKTNLARYVEDADEMYESIASQVRLKTIEQGAATQCLVATHPSLAGVGGKYFSDCTLAKTASIAQDEILAEALWNISEEIIQR